MSDADLDIEDLKSRVDLVALIGERVQLRRSGAQFTGSCPFHPDKNPSFFVHPERGFFCHGCGVKGDAISFLMMLDKQSFQEALAALAGTRSAAPRRATRRAAAPPPPVLDAKALWDKLSFRDDLGERYLVGRSILPSPPPSDVLRFNVGTSGNSWLDARACEGYRVAFAVRRPDGTVQTISLRYALTGGPPNGKKTLVVPGLSTKGAAIGSPEIQLLAEGEPEFAPDEVLLVEGGTSWLGASLFFAEAGADGQLAPVWPLGIIGVGNAAGVAEAFASVVRWRTVLLGFDADPAGEAACVAAADAAQLVGARNVLRIRAPGGLKDWADAAAGARR